MLYCNVLFLCWAVKRAGDRAGGRKCRAAWRGVGRASWLGRRAGRADWWEGAQARRVLATPALASAWCNVLWTCLPPGNQARGRAGAWLGQGGARRAGQGGGGLGGRAGGRVGWMGGTGMKGIASTLQWSLPAHTAHPRPSALCPNPRHATPLPSATPASPTFLLFGVPHLAIGLDQDMGQPTRRSSRDRATRIME